MDYKRFFKKKCIIIIVIGIVLSTLTVLIKKNTGCFSKALCDYKYGFPLRFMISNYNAGNMVLWGLFILNSVIWVILSLLIIYFINYLKNKFV